MKSKADRICRIRNSNTPRSNAYGCRNLTRGSPVAYAAYSRSFFGVCHEQVRGEDCSPPIAEQFDTIDYKEALDGLVRADFQWKEGRHDSVDEFIRVAVKSYYRRQE